MRKCAVFATEARACEDQLDPCIVVELLDGVRETVLGILFEKLLQRAPDVHRHAWPRIMVNLVNSECAVGLTKMSF